MQLSHVVALAWRRVVLLVRGQLKGVPSGHRIAARIVLRDAKGVILVRHARAEGDAARAPGAARLLHARRTALATALRLTKLLGALVARQGPRQV